MRSFSGMEGTIDVWMRHMRRGEFEAAWRVSDRIRRSHPPKAWSDLPLHCRPIWGGQPVQGKDVVVWCHHGLGDTIQFIRYLPLLGQIARTVTVRAPPELLPLLRHAAGIDQLIASTESSYFRSRAVEVEVMELPYVFRTTVKNLPANVPYLHLEPLRPSNAGLNVGLVWGTGDWDRRRNISLSELRLVTATGGITWHILQRGSALREWNRDFGVNSGSDDLLTAARKIAGLDLMISVDSMPAHLAGALGIQTWTLLHSQADWRWMQGREDSPWYPTMRLFRQSRAGSWTDVVARIHHRLIRLVNARSAFYDAARAGARSAALAPRFGKLRSRNPSM